MHLENNNSRSAFIRKTALAFVSIFGLGLAKFSFQNPLSQSRADFETLSEKEANERLKSIHSAESIRLKPMPPPQEQTY